MKTIAKSLALLLAATFALSFTNGQKKDKYKADISESQLTWIGRKVTGEHTGNVSLKTGELEVEGEKLVGGSFVIDMSSMTTTDLEGEMAGKLMGHLKSDDFFGVATHPTANFVITQVVHQGKDDYKIVGDLTIKGKTNQVKFPAKINMDDNTVTADATIVVDRSEYDIRYGSGSFFDNLGDKTIYDDFDINLHLVAKK